MGDTDFEKSLTLEENLKKALTEVLVLHLLSVRDRYIGELTSVIHDKSHGALTIVFPYSAFYRLQQSGYLKESEKKNAPDGRRRQYYQITESGRLYLGQLMNVYTRFFQGVTEILTEEDGSYEL